MKTKSLRSGWTLMEMLVVLVIIGLVLVIGFPNALSIKSGAEDKTAINKAIILNTAKASYLASNGRLLAERDWSLAPDDQARYTLIAPYLSFPPPDLARFTPAGYSFAFSTNIHARTTVTNTNTSTDLTPQTQ